MKKLILIFAAALIVSCQKENSCTCYRFVNDQAGNSLTYKYEVRSKLSKHKLKSGACASYAVTENSVTTTYQCKIN